MIEKGVQQRCQKYQNGDQKGSPSRMKTEQTTVYKVVGIYQKKRKADHPRAERSEKGDENRRETQFELLHPPTHTSSHGRSTNLFF